MKLVINIISKAPVMKFILRSTASGNEAITQNKWGSSGNRGSILHLTALFPLFLLPLLFPHPLEKNYPFRAFGTSHTSFFLYIFRDLYYPCGLVVCQGEMELGKITEFEKTIGLRFLNSRA